MCEYFPDNLPKMAPNYLIPEKRVAFQKHLQLIHHRMDKLNEACTMSSLSPQAFAANAKNLFDLSPTHFDQLDPYEIANIAGELDDGTSHPDRIWFPNAIPLFDTSFVTNAEWESLRCIGIGGSDAAVIDGTSHFSTQYDLYCTKRGINPAHKVKKPQAIYDRGHILEDKIIEMFCQISGARKLNNTIMWMSKEFPHCTANIDAVLELPNGQLCIFEAKTTILDNRFSWINDKIPAYYVGQTRQYPAVLNDDRIIGTHIGCLFTIDYIVNDLYLGSNFTDDHFVSRFIEREPETEREQLQTENQWFEDYVIAGKEPPHDSSAKTEIEALHKYSPTPKKGNPTIWDLDDYRDKLQKYLDVSQQCSQTEKELNALKEMKKDLSIPFIKDLGDKQEAHIPISSTEYYVVKNSPRGKTTIDKERLLDIIDSLAAYNVPDDVISNMHGCFEKEEDKYRVFDIKKEVKPITRKSSL